MTELNIEQERREFCNAIRAEFPEYAKDIDIFILSKFASAFQGWRLAKRAAQGSAEPVGSAQSIMCFMDFMRSHGHGHLLALAPIRKDGEPMFANTWGQNMWKCWQKSARTPPAPVSAGPVKIHDALRWSKANSDYHGYIAFTPDQLKLFVGHIQGNSPESASAEMVKRHSDDIAVCNFANAMSEKMAVARDKGRNGWEDCDPADLSWMLREHVEKGDPRDVANFCMMLWNLGHPIYNTRLPADMKLANDPSNKPINFVKYQAFEDAAKKVNADYLSAPPSTDAKDIWDLAKQAVRNATDSDEIFVSNACDAIDAARDIAAKEGTQ